jgi:hypothetical protein
MAAIATIRGIVMATANPLMRTLAQLSPPQSEAAVRAAGDSADDTTAIDSSDDGWFMRVVPSNSDRTQRSDLKQRYPAGKSSGSCLIQTGPLPTVFVILDINCTKSVQGTLVRIDTC